MSSGRGGTGAGETAFEAWYSSLFGPRWPGLREALLAPGAAVDYVDGLVRPYRMDRASVEAALALGAPEDGEILDACAAPGGKSLVIASRMGRDARLLCAELSPDRARRLVEVLDAHLEPGIRARVSVARADSASMCRKNLGRFRAILLDAPCSSERHVLASPSALAAWTPARVRNLASRQWALLSSCFLMLAPGGRLVYSTCALSSRENEDLVERLYAKYGGSFREIDPGFSGEPRARGRLALPDGADGAGPMYVFALEKGP